MSTTPKNMKPLDDIGPTGLAVADAVRSHRQGLGLSYASLEQRLDDIGYRIPLLGLRRIEARARRVDVDDLMALAVALEVPPITLLAHVPPDMPDPEEEQTVTGLPDDIGYGETRAWLRGDLRLTAQERLRFARRDIRRLDSLWRGNQEQLEALRADLLEHPDRHELRDRIYDFEGYQADVDRGLAMTQTRLESLEKEVSDGPAQG